MSSSIAAARIFRLLLLFVGFLVLVVVIVYTRLEGIDDDDIVASATRLHGATRNRGRPHQVRHTPTGNRHHRQQSDTSEKLQEFAQSQAETREERQRTQTHTARELFEKSHPPTDKARWQSFVADLRRGEPVSEPIHGYDILDCPLDPPDNYPFAWSLMEVLNNWKANETSALPSKIYQGLCVFDWETDQDKARNYRNKDLPFVLHNFPEAVMTAERWNTPGYMEQMINQKPPQTKKKKDHRHHIANTNNQETQATFYTKWLKRAQSVMEAPTQEAGDPWYFRLSVMLQGDTSYLYEELPFFDPSKGKSFTMVDPDHHRGINCRFGMKGIVSQSHYDAQNNFIVLLGGQRRYILAHPDQCSNMELNPKGHSNARHSRIDWSRAHELLDKTSQPITKAKVNEVVLQAGDLLYLPTYWFHYIVSLNTNYQCNSRSGVSLENSQHIMDCGFDAAKA